jgi:preprotein translocase subunit SecG
LSVYLNIVQIIVSVALIALAVMQGKSSSAGRMFGGDSSIHRTRRGMEKTLFNLTIIMAVVFFVTALLNVLIQS